ncbi:MFS transporter [Alloalcanivorax xenomutans]|uniref:MFS transporter n=1 Tax=Alloalcanivorax xenomutans TaxID=1094342 RepID=UPI0024E1DE9D|nr:MFS transporter [Alloalcanivorax xenomutans]
MAIVLTGLNLRPILAAVGPVLDDIQAATSLGDSAAGLLTTLPVLAMGVCALLAGALQRQLGEFRGVTLGIIIIALACGSRLIRHDGGSLILGAALGGLGIALIQALLPAFIKRVFPTRIGMVMGLYSCGIMGGAAFAAASTSPLSGSLGWPGALAIWALPAFLAAVLWWLAASAYAAPVDATRVSLPIHSPRAWLLMTFFGIGTGAYTLVLAWLPPYYVELGLSANQGGLLLVVLSLVLAGLAGLILAPIPLALPVVIVLGLGIGALFPSSLIVTMDHAANPAEASTLMGFVQGGGYIIASTMPLVAGILREQLSALSYAWAVMAVGVLILMVMASRLTPRPVPATT